MGTKTAAEKREAADVKADVLEAKEAKARRFLRESPDCAAVEWAGVRYEFDEHQRKVVARLWSRREDDKPYESGERRLALSGSSSTW